MCLIYRYIGGITLAGVLYFHKISKNRVGGEARRNIRIFKKLCGEHALKNVIIVTTMWQFVDQNTGDKRQIDLEGNDLFFKSIKTAGGRFARHNNTSQSAENIIRLLLHKSHSPLPLHIQKELTVEGIDIRQTMAAVVLDEDKKNQVERLRRQRDEIMEDMKEAILGMAEDYKELKGEVEETDRWILKLENDRKMLEAEYQKQRKAFEEYVERETKKGQSEKPHFLEALGNKKHSLVKKGSKASAQ